MKPHPNVQTSAPTCAANVRVAQLVDFAATHGAARNFPGWARQSIEDFLVFHCQQNTCAYVMEAGQVIGLAVGWQCHERDTQAAGFALQPFTWQPTNPQGDSFLFCDLIAVKPVAVACLIGEFQWRFPLWRRLKFLAVRNGRVIEYQRREKFLALMEAIQ